MRRFTTLPPSVQRHTLFWYLALCKFDSPDLLEDPEMVRAALPWFAFGKYTHEGRDVLAVRWTTTKRQWRWGGFCSSSSQVLGPNGAVSQ